MVLGFFRFNMIYHICLVYSILYAACSQVRKISLVIDFMVTMSLILWIVPVINRLNSIQVRWWCERRPDRCISSVWSHSIASQFSIIVCRYVRWKSNNARILFKIFAVIVPKFFSNFWKSVVAGECNETKTYKIDDEQKQKLDQNHTKQSYTTNGLKPGWWRQRKTSISIRKKTKKWNHKRANHQIDNASGGKFFSSHAKIIKDFLLYGYKIAIHMTCTFTCAILAKYHSKIAIDYEMLI